MITPRPLASANHPVPILLVCGGAPETDLINAARLLLQHACPQAMDTRAVQALRYESAGLVGPAAAPSADLRRGQRPASRSVSSAGVIVRERYFGSAASPRIESTILALAHPCLACAIREDLPLAVAQAVKCGAQAVAVVLPPAMAPDVAIEALAGQPLALRLHGTVSIADAGTWLEDVCGREPLIARGWHLIPGDTGNVAAGLISQAEQSDAIVLLNTWRLPTTSLEGIHAALAHLAPQAQLTHSEDGHIPVSQIRGLPRRRHLEPGWKTFLRAADAELARTGAVVHTTGPITSFAWRARPPLHPSRLAEVIPELVNTTMRGRGCLWLPARPHQIVDWDHLGRTLRLAPNGHWAAADLPFVGPTGSHRCPPRYRQPHQWHPRYGDRVHEIALIGHLDPDGRHGDPLPLRLLRECLLDDDPAQPLDWAAALDDPFAEHLREDATLN